MGRVGLVAMAVDRLEVAASAEACLVVATAIGMKMVAARPAEATAVVDSAAVRVVVAMVGLVAA